MFEGAATARTDACDFVAGFASRHVASADRLARVFDMAGPFAATGVVPTPPPAPREFNSEPPGPRHFSPADRDANPTEGWDPFAAAEAHAEFVDPIAVAHAEGYEAGLLAGRAQVTADIARDRALVTELAEALATSGHVDRDSIALALRRTVMTLVTRIVGDIGVCANHLAERIDAAADLLADGAESAILRMNPLDVNLVAGKLPKAVFPVGDTAVERGGFVLESASTIVEDGPSLWLDQLGAAIERVPVPPSC